MPTLQYKSFLGAEILQVLDSLAALRIAVFKDYPYLYDGDVSYEKQYLQTYINAPQAFLFAVFDENQMVGATTCIPLADETEEVQEPFIAAQMSIDQICYFGESILLGAYRGKGIGVQFFKEREAHARRIGSHLTSFCAVKRPDNHPLRPANYVDLSKFWHKRGYLKSDTLKSTFEWKDIDENTASPKLMEYWLKEL